MSFEPWYNSLDTANLTKKVDLNANLGVIKRLMGSPLGKVVAGVA